MPYPCSYGLCDVLKLLYLEKEIYWLLHKRLQKASPPANERFQRLVGERERASER